MENHVVDSRLSPDGVSIRRRRECGGCEHRFTTYERVEVSLPYIIKKDGSRVPFAREKVAAGVRRACEKRPVSVEAIEAFVDRLEYKLQGIGEKELSSRVIGEEVMDFLRDVDEVAYVRFASVYRSFRDVGEFMQELKELIDEAGNAGKKR